MGPVMDTKVFFISMMSDLKLSRLSVMTSGQSYHHIPSFALHKQIIPGPHLIQPICKLQPLMKGSSRDQNHHSGVRHKRSDTSA